LLIFPPHSHRPESAPTGLDKPQTVSTDHQLMIEIIAKLILTIIASAMYFSALYFIWTKHIDVYRTLIKPLESFIQTNDSNVIQTELKGIILSRYVDPSGGPFALLFYNSIIFINRSDKAVTIKDVHLRFEIGGITKVIELSDLKTDRTETPDGPMDAALFYFLRDGKVNTGVMLRWKNFRDAIAEEKPIIPGAVLTGNGAFRLAISSLDDLNKISKFELVITDYSGNDTVETILPQAIWAQEGSTTFFDDRRFIIDASGKVTYLN
jgi:hypothetical protein